jgi:hypothetical protein
MWQYGIEHLTISLIEEIGNPQQENNLPLVGFRIYVYLHNKFNISYKGNKKYPNPNRKFSSR